MRRALQLSDGSVSGLVNTTFSVTVYAIVLVILLWPLIRKVVSTRRGSGRALDEAGRK
jgi:putative tricarboxylic transport membrane protein